MLHTETVLPHTFDLLKRLMGDEKLKHFNLVGGTALSLQIGHRMSIDIDLFSGERFSVEELKEHLSRNYDHFMESRTNEFTVISTMEDNIKVDFISYPYSLIEDIAEEEGIRMYSLNDISAMKLSAIGNNGTRLKDFVDIACLSSYSSFNVMLENFEKKFPAANPVHIVRSLGYHNDIVHEEIKMIHYKYDWKPTRNRIVDMLKNPNQRYHSFPFSLLQNHVDAKKMTDLQTYTDLSERFLKNKADVALDVMKQLKQAEYAVNIYNLRADERAVFFAKQKEVNREIAYRMTRNVDIVPFIKANGYVSKQSTQRWPRYEKGDEVVLVTDGNTLYNVKTGQNTNLYDFIQKNYVKSRPDISGTKHMIDTVLQNEGLQIFVRPQDGHIKPEQSVNTGEKKTFDINDYRIERLNPHKNYLLKRGISVDTLQNPLFYDTIFQGNKARIDQAYNNVIYPFKDSPTEDMSRMKTLLQQYGRKIMSDNKPVDKVFAHGHGKSRSLWFSNVPEKVGRIYVFENPLDALSHYQKYQPSNALYAATGGNPAQGQYMKISEVCKELKIRPVLCFDNDLAGCRFDTSYMASVCPERLSIEKTGEDFYHVKLSDLSESELKNAESVFHSRGIQIIGKDENSIVARIAGVEKACAFNNFVNVCVVKTDAKIEKSVMKDFNDDLSNNLTKQYASMAESRKCHFRKF